ncbi:MAG: thermonuclease family protein, partial [Candidatus Omnitrophica bacterium]|nr:thermonuclease family protein [Candidatus Omnitrophota bacterium]
MQVTEVTSGDEIYVSRDGKPPKLVRLYGLDAPGPDQPFCADARDFVRAAVSKGLVRMDVRSMDTNKVELVDILLEDDIHLSAELARNGLAWVLPYSKDKELAVIEQEARAGAVGLWSQEKPVEPWVFRKSAPIAVSETKTVEKKPHESRWTSD